MKINNFKQAFTLAEILIVLTLIGAMAVMTIPSLMQGTNSQQKITQFKKAFNALTNAYASEFVTKTPPTKADATSADNTKAIFYALNNQLNVKYYLDGSGKKFSIPTTGTVNYGDYWIITEDGIAYKVVPGAANVTCKDKLAVNSLKSSTGITTGDNATCYSIAVNLDGGTTSSPCADNDDINNLSCNQTSFYVTNDGITSGNPDCTITGRIISGTETKPDSCNAS